MKLEQCLWNKQTGWTPKAPGVLKESAQLVLLFAGKSVFKEKDIFQEIQKSYPQAALVGCSTAGEICGTQVTDDSLVLTAAAFEHTALQAVKVTDVSLKTSAQAGETLAKALKKEGLMHVFVISEGINVNGSALVWGLTKNLPSHVRVTGGLSGDGDRFQETFVISDSAVEKNAIVAVGFYGDRLKVGYGSLGGWDAFGPERLITKSQANVLYELDGKSALDLYKKYLGDHAQGLPATGLLFPLKLRSNGHDTGVVRTILAVDERAQSMTFAGDVPVGSYAQLMRANFDRLIDGAMGAAKTSYEAIGSVSPELAVLISCVGRKMILNQRVEEEVEGVQNILGKNTILTGFYSYGEISPFTPQAKCELHNQTMTITTFRED